MSTVTSCAGHSKSWQYGYDNANYGINFLKMGVSLKFACSTAAAGLMMDAPKLDRDEVTAGCIQGIKDAQK